MASNRGYNSTRRPLREGRKNEICGGGDGKKREIQASHSIFLFLSLKRLKMFLLKNRFCLFFFFLLFFFFFFFSSSGRQLQMDGFRLLTDLILPTER